MTWNRQQFVNALLLDLDIVALGQAPADEEYEAADARLDTIVAELYARRVLYLPDLDQIPDEVVEPFRAIVALMLGPAYGKPPVDAVTQEVAEMRLKAVSQPPRTRRTLSTEGVLRHGARRFGHFPGPR